MYNPDIVWRILSFSHIKLSSPASSQVKNMRCKKSIMEDGIAGRQDEDVIAEAELVDAMMTGKQGENWLD